MFIILNNAVYGVITSLLIHTLNSIMKVFATAIELILITVLSWAFLGYSVTLQTGLAVCIVSCSILLYAKHPIEKSMYSNVPKNDNQNITNV